MSTTHLFMRTRSAKKVEPCAGPYEVCFRDQVVTFQARVIAGSKRWKLFGSMMLTGKVPPFQARTRSA